MKMTDICYMFTFSGLLTLPSRYYRYNSVKKTQTFSKTKLQVFLRIVIDINEKE